MTTTQRKTGAQVRENLIGRSLHDGEYLIQSVLGHGGMGKVYLVTHSSLTVPLALKQARADQPLPESVIAELDAILQGDETTRARKELQEDTFPSSGGTHTDRFLREALLLARLLHPAIPTLYDYFFEDGYWYLVMDYIPGLTLSAYLRKHAPLPPLEALNYAMQLCDVLDYLHSQSPPVIFRDLKPSNVLLTPEGTLMIVDFGIARYFKIGQVNDTTDFGSPGYASPEQYQCAGQTDGRSDLYSLGIILHEMLSGQRPASSGGVFDTPQHIDPSISSTLSGLVTLATRPDPAHRFQSAHTFYLALERAYAIEERRAYHRQALRASEQPSTEIIREELLSAILAENNNLASSQDKAEQDQAPPTREAQEVTTPPASSTLPSPPLDTEQRRQTRLALQRARKERLAEENLEIQMASVDESLKRRSFIALSQTVHYRLAEPEKPEQPTRLLRLSRKLHRPIRAGFLLALSLFLVMASLLTFLRVQHSISTLPGRPTARLATATSNASYTATANAFGSSWHMLPSPPASEADNAATYAMVQGREYIYMSGGYSGAKHMSYYDHNLYRYDVDAAHWQTVTPTNMSGMLNNAAATDEQGQIFFTAGYSTDSYNTISRLYVYRPATGTWNTITPTTQISIGFGGAMLADQHGHLYIIQGFLNAGDPHAQAGTGWYRYDISSGQWHQLAHLPVGLGYVLLTLDTNGGILMLGGATDEAQHLQTNKVYRYDIAHDSWSEPPILLPQPLSGAAGCQANQNQFVMLGGYDAVHNKGLDATWLLNLHTLQWQGLPPLPFGGSVLGTAACNTAGRIFIARGANDPMLPTRDFWELAIPTKTNS